MSDKKGYFMKPQNFSVNDGDGIRTVIFFATCPLSCKWCSNPESHVFTGDMEEVNKVEEYIYEYSTEEILDLLEKQYIFYRYSGGGVTFSGGEATCQADILRELVYKLYDDAINLAIETSGYFNFEELEDILKKLDLIFVDIKHMNSEKHKRYTGVPNKRILDNIKSIGKIDTEIVIRIPLIKGFNADIENISKTAKFVSKYIKNPKIELLPYHSFGEKKYKDLGLKEPEDYFETPMREEIEKLYSIIEDMGVNIIEYK